ncbi:hypothetical protein Lal_00023248 [Lupinus albus]|uniref:Uncharacterized protein n=1 Tax=Lupinus albus TaxID=3870 RepID=A0A6A4NTK2_LUPAL|nr:hypothetical protein Lalb_Chr20g0113781 [Lupinus albus]KAF1881213.1 hypothetical protein Lal_00023248 [Lupinus albus]
MEFSYTKIMFIVPQVLLMLLIILATYPQYGVDCRPLLLLNHDQSRAYQLHFQALPRDPAPNSGPGGQGHGHR